MQILPLSCCEFLVPYAKIIKILDTRSVWVIHTNTRQPPLSETKSFSPSPPMRWKKRFGFFRVFLWGSAPSLPLIKFLVRSTFHVCLWANHLKTLVFSLWISYKVNIKKDKTRCRGFVLPLANLTEPIQKHIFKTTLTGWQWAENVWAVVLYKK